MKVKYSKHKLRDKYERNKNKEQNLTYLIKKKVCLYSC